MKKRIIPCTCKNKVLYFDYWNGLHIKGPRTIHHTEDFAAVSACWAK